MAPTLVGSWLPPAVSTHPTHLTFLPPAQGSALSSQPVTLTASGRNSTRSRPWEVEMSQRCVCLPWRSGPPPCPSLSLPSYAALPGPATRGTGTGQPSPLSPSFLPGPLCSALPGSTHSCHRVYRQPFLPQLALLHTPPLSDVFVFTDASPKDAFLTNRVESLSRERRCRVSAALAA